MFQEKINSSFQAFATIVPLRRVPRQFEILSYGIPSGMAVATGDVVEMPFGKTSIWGVVLSQTKTRPSFAVKAIEKVSQTRLPPHALELITFMVNEFGCSYTKALELFITPDVARQLNKKSDQESEMNAASNATIATTTKSHKQQSARTTLLIEKNRTNRHELIEKIAQSATGTVLVIVPDHYSLDELIKKLEPKLNEVLLPFHGELTPKKRTAVWKAAFTGERKIIVATRLGIYLPFTNLEHIVFFDEDNAAYRELREPHYHAADVAFKLAQLLQVPLTHLSPTPRLETWIAAQNKTTKSEAFFISEAARPTAHVEIISMKDERRRHNFSALAEASVAAVARALAEQKQVLIFVNRRGTAGMVICNDCYTPLTCPRCENLFTLHDEEQLLCHLCHMTKNLPESCAVCGGTQLDAVLIGTQGIEKQLNTIFDHARVVRVDSDTTKRSRKNRMGITEGELESADILVATQILNKQLNLPRLAVSVAVSPDSLLNIPSIDGLEQALSLLNRLKQNTREQMIIQTMLPENQVYVAVQSGSIDTFMKNEAELRKLLKIPPFDSH